MATQTQANNCKYSVEKHYTDSTKTTFSHYWVRCYDKNGNYCEWKDTVSAADATDETLLTNAKAHFKEHCEEKAAAVKPADDAKTLN